MNAAEIIGRKILEAAIAMKQDCIETKAISGTHNIKIEAIGVTMSIEMEFVAPLVTDEQVMELYKCP